MNEHGNDWALFKTDLFAITDVEQLRAFFGAVGSKIAAMSKKPVWAYYER